MAKRGFAEQAGGWTSWSEIIFLKKLPSYLWKLGDKEVISRIKGRRDGYTPKER